MVKTAITAESSSATELSSKTILSVLHDFGAPLFVWGVWALMLLVALAFVGTYGANIPFWDDVGYVVALTGDQPIIISWLWSPHNVHRVPLPRLILLGLYRLSGDFRTAMLFNILALGALAFAMIWIAKRLRGRMSYADAFFPLALLHPGHCPNLLWSWQVGFILPTVLAGMLLLITVLEDARRRLGAALLAGICLVFLPLCGANGVALVPPLALWLGYIGFRHWRLRGPHSRRDGLLILSLASSALLLSGLYFLDFHPSPNDADGSKILAVLQSGILFLGQGFGPLYEVPLGLCLKRVYAANPWTVARWIIAIGVAGLLLSSTVALVAISLKQPRERPRALGLLLFLGAMASLALVLGYGRPGNGGLTNRYAILAVPALCCAYFVWSIYGGRKTGSFVTSSMFFYSLIMLTFHVHTGLSSCRYHNFMMVSLENDLAAGVPNFVLSARYSALLAMSTQNAHDYLEMMHRAGIGKFRLMKEDPAFREVSLPVASAALHRMTLEDGAARGTGANSYLVFTLPEAAFVGGVRFKYSHSDRGDAVPEPFLVSWKGDERHSFTEARSNLTSQYFFSRREGLCGGTREEAVMVWVGDSLKQLRIGPDPDSRLPDDSPCPFRISEVSLLVPADKWSGDHTGSDDEYGKSLRSPRAYFFLGPYSWPVRLRNAWGAFFRDVISGAP